VYENPECVRCGKAFDSVRFMTVALFEDFPLDFGLDDNDVFFFLT
jgi:hypothetical protein